MPTVPIDHDKALADFAKSLAQDEQIFLELCTDGLAQIAEDTHNLLIKQTPVDTGMLKASWVVTLDAKAKGTRRRKKQRRKRGQVVFSSDAAALESQKSQAVLDGLKTPFIDVFITNTQDYASFVDVGAQAQKPRNPSKKPQTTAPSGGGVKAYNITQLTIAQMQERAYVVGNAD